MRQQTQQIADIVQAARSGDPAAWTELVERFQDFAVAVAVGQGADWDAARDVAQEAFLLAFTKLEDLRDPQAFAGWFAALVRTAGGRRARRPALTAERVELEFGPAGVSQEDPLGAVLSDERSQLVRRAVEALPEHERTVIALHFLADLEFAEIARFLGIGESAARKRAHSARQRLKELEVMTIDTLTAARPSRDDGFRDELLLFSAVDRGDAGAVRRILARRPELVESAEAWSWSEALAAGLGTAQRGTPLVRAVEAGAEEVVAALLECGAPVDGRCRCNGAETPLWTAVVTDQKPMVELLLTAGADPNTPSFNGATPMHVAGQRNPELLDLLAAAGGDLDRRDGGGRTPRDWAELRRARSSAGAPAGPGSGMVVTGIRTVDLFAPLFRGSRQYWPAAVGVGQLVLPFGIADALDGVELWWVGFEHGGHYANGALQAESRELDVPARVRLAEPGPAAARSRRFTAALEEIAATPGEKLVVVIGSAEHRHEIALAVHGLSVDPLVLSSIVVEPLGAVELLGTGRLAESAAAIPEGYDTVLCFDAELAEAGRFPAVDPLRSQTRLALAERHARAVQAVRAGLTGAIRDDLVQRLRLGEPFGSIPGVLTPFEETLGRIERLVAAG